MAGPYDTIPSVSQAAITNLTQGVRHDVLVYLHTGGDLWTPDLEEAIQHGWIPGDASWVDVTTAIVPGSTIKIAADNTINLQVHNQSRADWPDDGVICVVARHWDGTAWGSYYVAGWGFIRGDGKQDDSRFTQSGDVICTYIDRFKKIQLPSQRFGRRNLAVGATIAASSPPIASPSTEAPLEYVSQPDTAGARAIDGKRDTVYIADVICDPARPVMGDSEVPRVLRFYAGRDVRTIGAGGEPIFLELWCGHNIIPWGTSWTGIPQMYNEGAGEGQPAIRTDAHLSTSVLTYGDGTKGFQVRAFQNSSYVADTWLQWIVYSGFTKRPIRVSIDVRAGSPSSVGKALNLWITDASPSGSSRRDFNPLLLADEWAHFDFSFDSGTYGGAKLNIKTLPGELISGDVYYEIRNFRIDVGWDNDAYGKDNDYRTVWLGLDDGIGHEKWVKVAWNLEKDGNWRIPPFDTVILCDDIGVFKSKFDPGDRQVYQLKNVFPTWFIGPSPNHCRLRVVLMNNPAVADLFNIDGLPGDAIILDDLSFDMFGWVPHQGVVRNAPMGIGSGGVAGPFTTEEYPQPGMEQTYGSAYLWVDTGAYVPPKLNRDISATDLYIPVDDTDAYPVAGTIRIGTEYILYGAKRDEYLVAYARGANSSIPAAHSRSDAVYPCYDANADSGLSVQTGALVDRVTIVRQDGKPVIEDGALLWSNLPGPGDPSTGGQLWERHPDWNLATRWQGNQSSIIEYVPPVAPVTLGSAHVRQARHWCVVGHRMQYYFGRPQRFKINEVSIWEFSPHAGVSGGYEGHGAGDFPGVVGHIVTQHAGLPVSKFGSTVSGAGPIGELHITPTTVQSALGSTLGNQYMTVYNDRWNNIYLTALPGSVLFPATLVSWTWTELNCWGGRITGGWSEAHPCAQAIVWATEPAALRQYYYEYPPVADRLGNTVEARDVIVASYDQGREIARALYRSARTRRSIQLSAGACPWLNKYQRHVVNLPGLDKGGAWSGINMYVRDYTVEIGMSPNGITWNTTIQLAELAL